jgi:hypothetical protein
VDPAVEEITAMKIMMNVACLVAGAVACLGCNEPDPAPGGVTPAPLSAAEEKLIVERGNASRLAEISLPDKKVEIFEPAPGDIVVVETFPLETLPAAVPSELGPAALFRLLAPGQSPTPALLEAQARFETSDLRSDLPPADLADGSGGIAPAAASTTAIDRDGVTTAQSALAVAFPQFASRWCSPYAGPIAASWCVSLTIAGAYARWYTHSSGSVVCGQTGGAKFRIRWSGIDRHIVDVPYGTCSRYSFHSAHDWLGQPLLRTLELFVHWAEDLAGFAGYFVTANHPFITVPPGFN